MADRDEGLYPLEPQSLGKINSIKSFINDLRLILTKVSDNEEALEDNENDEEQMVNHYDDQCFKITETEDSRLFRKFLITWEKYFNSKPQVYRDQNRILVEILI